MAKDDGKLRRAVEAAALAAFERDGPNYTKGAVARQFKDSGTSRATLYRWIEGIATSGQTAALMAERLSHIEPPSETPEEVVSLAKKIVRTMPPIVRPQDIVGQGGTISVVERLQQSMALAAQIIKQATNEDGSIRLTKTALAASEHSRRCLETAIRMAESLREISKVDEFHMALIEEVAKESPEAAERVLARLHHMTATWNRGF